MRSTLAYVTAPLINNNPITLQILGICSALAVTTSPARSPVMSAALTAVLCLSSAAISLIRNHIPDVIRLIVQIVIIASLVVVIDEILRAYAFGLSRQLSIFVGLIVTNCLVLGRTESFALRNPIWPAVSDGFGNGLGYSLILIIIGSIREILGKGTLLGRTILPPASDGGWFEPLALMQLAPGAFFTIGLLIWGIRRIWVAQVDTAKLPLKSATVAR